MKSKYNVGDKVWTISANFNRKEIYAPDFVTIEEIKEVGRNNNILFGRVLDIGTFIYKMEEGCSYWRAEDEIFLSKTQTTNLITQAKQKLEKKMQLKEKFENLVKRGINVDDGIYDIEGIEFLAVDANIESAIEWIENHEKFWIADAYETDFPILLSDEPRCLNSKKWNEECWIGSGFNYGSTNIIKNCPKDILILAEND